MDDQLPNTRPRNGSLPDLETSRAESPSRFQFILHRKRNLSKRSRQALLGNPPPDMDTHLPSDATQPSSGSIPDVHVTASTLPDVDIGVFPDSTPFRQRSYTCPEGQMPERKSSLKPGRNQERPLTPPPGTADDATLETELHKLALKEKLCISTEDLPVCIPEDI